MYHRFVDEVATIARRGFTIESSGHVYVRGLDAERQREVVQETFAKAFAEKARLAYDGVQPYRPYLLRIAKHVMIDRFRAEQRTTASIDDEGIGDIDALLARNADLPVADAPEDLHWKTLRTATTEYVATLDEQTRQIVALRFEQELAQDEVASRLGVSRRRVRSAEDSVQSGLRKHLKHHGLLDD